MSVPREKLFEEVWAEPMTTVAKRYDVSSSFLARVCERLNVPRPPRGYWAQLKFGRKLAKPLLPAGHVGDECEWSRDGCPRRYAVSTAPTPKATPVTQPAKRRRPGERPSRHPLLVGVRDDFEEGRVSDTGYLKPKKRSIVDVFVSKDVLKRTLDLANELFLTLEDRGHRVLFQPSPARYNRPPLMIWDEGVSRDDRDRWVGPGPDTIALVNGAAIGLTFFEITAEFATVLDPITRERVRKGPPKTSKPNEPFDWRFQNLWLPSGRIGIRAYAARSGIAWDRYWREGRPGELATLIEAIADEVESGSPAIEKLIEKQEREAEVRRVEHEKLRLVWAKEAEERRRVEAEAAKEKDIVQTITNWRMVRDVRAYVAEVHALIDESKVKITPGGGVEEELNWALAYADRLDPLTSWRRDIQSTLAYHAGKPCAECGKVHVAGAHVPVASGDSDLA